MKLFLNYKSKKFGLDVEVCNLFRRFWGLMFCRREKAKSLMFVFNKPKNISIHSFFVFFPFVAIWLDDKDKIVDLRMVKPFRFGVYPKKSSTKIVEIPVNKKYRGVIKLLCS